MSLEFNAKHYFDPETCRMYINNELSVFHCHHYSTLFSQLANDASALNGPLHLRNAAEESLGPVLVKYFKDSNINDVDARKMLAEQYFSYIGLGELKITSLSNNGGTAEMLNSHVDEGWIKKWSTYDKPINFIGQGFLAGAFSAITNTNMSSFIVEETQSIVSGAKKSMFTIKLK